MARKKAAKGAIKGSKMRVAGASAVKSMGLVGALAAALAGGGYYIGKNGSDKIAALMPEKIAALLPAEKAAPKAAQAPEAKTEAKPAESPIVKLADKAELTRLLKGAEAKIVGYVRPEPEKRAKTAKADARKADANKADAGKTETSKTDAPKADAAKADAAKPDAKAAAKAARAQAAKAQTAAADAESPVPPARIPDAGKTVARTDTKTGRTEAKAAPEPDAAPTSIADALAETVAPPAAKPESAGGAPLVASLTGKGIPTSEDSKIRLSVGFSNRTGRPIRAFEGVLKFTDRADRSLFSSKISVSALIAEGGTINWDERVDPDKLGKTLVDADKDSLKAVFVPKKVFFVDGSVQQFAAGAGGAHLASR